MKIVPMSVTAADKTLIVDLHNKMRRQVAKAMEKRGNPGPQPAAANMREMARYKFQTHHCQLLHRAGMMN
jgi:hypothetical protein